MSAVPLAALQLDATGEPRRALLPPPACVRRDFMRFALSLQALRPRWPLPWQPAAATSSSRWQPSSTTSTAPPPAPSCPPLGGPAPSRC
jgi:hypothetical protein